VQRAGGEVEEIRSRGMLLGAVADVRARVEETTLACIREIC
jgi:hypothetical protein